MATAARHKVKVLYRLPTIITQRVLGTITHVRTQTPAVALTFDDGPHPEYTPRLLDILDKHGAKATFFMVGRIAQRYPRLVQQIALAGHAIGNHSWDHPSFPMISRRERWAQLRACARALAPYGQRLFRPPYGHQSRGSRLDALLMGYQVVTWSLHVEDWLHHGADWMANRLIHEIRPGSIILLHDALYHVVEEHCADRTPMLEAVDLVLERLDDQFRFVTVPELLRIGQPHRQLWYRGPNVKWLNQLKGHMGRARRYAEQ